MPLRLITEDLCVKLLNGVHLVPRPLLRGCYGDPVAVVTARALAEPGPPEDRGGVSGGVASLPLIWCDISPDTSEPGAAVRATAAAV